MEDLINHYNQCWADDLGVLQKVVCYTCQSEVLVFMRNSQTGNKRRGSKQEHEENDEL